MPTLTLPNLTTLAAKPSWLNRAGQVDRSACLELRAANLWPHATFRTYRGSRRPGSRHPKSLTQREAVATYKVTANLLFILHSQISPRTLAGDWRTHKSNAMKMSRTSGGTSMDHRVAVAKRSAATESHAPGLDFGLPANPNKGAARTKMLGLPTDWTQDVRLERWRLHDRLAQHFLICPNCMQRCLKLFLPLCTEAELRDALTAQLWLRTHLPAVLPGAHFRGPGVRHSSFELQASAQAEAARYSLLVSC